MAEAFLGLGSNLGDREALLRAAVAGLAAIDGVTLTAASPIYETAPWGPVAQGPYLNACIALETRLPPRTLLWHCHAIEHRHGRERGIRFGPRTLDIDLLAYDALKVDAADLMLPHPRLIQRAFVLVPLADLAPNLAIAGLTVADWLGRTGRDGIELRADLAPLIPPRG